MRVYISPAFPIGILLVSCLISCGESNRETTPGNEPSGKENVPVTKNVSTPGSPVADTVSPDLAFLKTFHDKYPHDVKLLENPVFTRQLQKLLGPGRFTFLKETWAVEIPMTYKDNIFIASACQAHNCSSTNFIIVYDFSKQQMYAGIREEDQVTIYPQNGRDSPQIREWISN